MGNSCIFCLETTVIEKYLGTKKYSQCTSCNGVFINREFLPVADDEKHRYELHQNTLEDTGYRAYLESFINIFKMIPNIHNIFDYGCGPAPALVELLKNHGYDARGWDPFFAPDTERFENGADLVTCLEVAEHFFNPQKDFSLISNCLKPDGYLVLGTHPVPQLSEQKTWNYFDSWWYRQDTTHVSFYTEKSLACAAASAGLTLINHTEANVFIFKK